MFTPEEAARYARHLVLKDFGGQGQQRLKSARILVVGAGGLGSPAIAYLAAAGVGTLGIADHDHVAISDLQRQIIHRADALGRPKPESAADHVRAQNPQVNIVPHATALDRANAAAIVSDYDIVLDGTDNLLVRRAVASACAAREKPLVSGAVVMFDGQLTVLAPFRSRADGTPWPRFGDLYPEAATDADAPSCELAGVLGPVAGVIGTLMAVEAVKLVTGIGEPLLGRLLLYDGRGGRFSEISY